MCWMELRSPVKQLSPPPRNCIRSIRVIATAAWWRRAVYSYRANVGSSSGSSDAFAMRSRCASIVCTLAAYTRYSASHSRHFKILRASAKEPNGSGTSNKLDMSQKGFLSPTVVFGDVIVASVIAPLIAVFYARVKVFVPTWFAVAAQTERGFVFPEFAHGLVFSICWIVGGFTLGAFAADALNPNDLVKTIKQTWIVGMVSAFLTLSAWTLLYESGLLLIGYEMLGFVTQAHIVPTIADVAGDLFLEVTCLVGWRFNRAVDLAGAQATESSSLEPSKSQSFFTRITNPDIFDNRLILCDMVVSGLLVPCLVVGTLVQTNVYTPQWMVLLGASQYGISSAVLGHGAVLAFCWIVGALLTGAFSYDSVNPLDLPGTLKRTWVAGLVAAAALVALTVAGFFVTGSNVDAGMDFDASRKLGRTIYDLLLDINVEAACMTAWRLAYAEFL